MSAHFSFEFGLEVWNSWFMYITCLQYLHTVVDNNLYVSISSNYTVIKFSNLY